MPRRSSNFNQWRRPGQDNHGRVVSSEYDIAPSPSPLETPTPSVQESPEQFWDEYQFERRVLMLAKSLVSQPKHKFCCQIAHLMRHDQKELQRLIQKHMGRRPLVPFRNWRDHDLTTGERWQD